MTCPFSLQRCQNSNAAFACGAKPTTPRKRTLRPHSLFHSQPPRRLFHWLELRIGRDSELRSEEAETVGGVDIALQRLNVGQTVLIAVIIAIRREKRAEMAFRLLREIGNSGDGFVMMSRVDEPPDGAHQILEIIDERGAVLLDEALPRDQHSELRRAH